jgi:hypothetical protein
MGTRHDAPLETLLPLHLCGLALYLTAADGLARHRRKRE